MIESDLGGEGRESRLHAREIPREAKRASAQPLPTNVRTATLATIHHEQAPIVGSRRVCTGESPRIRHLLQVYRAATNIASESADDEPPH